jgi:hypothetical protein
MAAMRASTLCTIRSIVVKHLSLRNQTYAGRADRKVEDFDANMLSSPAVRIMSDILGGTLSASSVEAFPSQDPLFVAFQHHAIIFCALRVLLNKAFTANTDGNYLGPYLKESSKRLKEIAEEASSSSIPERGEAFQKGRNALLHGYEWVEN